MPKLKKIYGRPLLPWWVYIGYFLLAATIILWNSVAHGDDMKPATGKVAEKAKKGRKGDTRLAHINPFEEAILKALGGSGTTNPRTGYKEYFAETGDASGVGGDFAGDAGTDRFGGSGEEGFGYSEAEAMETGLYGDSFNPNDSSFDPGLSPAGPPGTPGRSPASETGVRHGLESILNRNAQYAMMPFGMGLAARGVKAFNDYAFEGKARADFPDGIGGASRDDAIMGALGAQPVAQPTPAAFAPPAEMTPPPSLGLAGGLTDLQRRAQIATGGSQGQSGVYRTPEAMKYYGNLIARALVGNNGQPAQENSNILPVEQQYLRQVYGINQSDKAAALLDALKPYWSR